MFRLFDEESGANNWALEFVADPGRRAERAAVLTRLPDALADAGVVGTCLGEFRRALEQS